MSPVNGLSPRISEKKVTVKKIGIRRENCRSRERGVVLPEMGCGWGEKNASLKNTPNFQLRENIKSSENSKYNTLYGQKYHKFHATTI